jgi:hypothetical protein
MERFPASYFHFISYDIKFIFFIRHGRASEPGYDGPNFVASTVCPVIPQPTQSCSTSSTVIAGPL